MKRKEFIKAIEKREPKKLEPSLFQQMLSNVFPYHYEESDDEEEEEKKDKVGEVGKKEEKKDEGHKHEGCCGEDHGDQGQSE